MVEISEVMEEDAPRPQAAAVPAEGEDGPAESRSEERLSDADEIEMALSYVTRPSAQLHVQNLITKLRKEGKALQRVAASKAASSSSSSPAAASTEEDHDSAAAMDVEESANEGPPRAPPKDPPVPKRAPAEAPVLSKEKYQSFPTYYFDAGKYDSPTVGVYVPLEGIGRHDRAKISCSFTAGSFDLIVRDWNGMSYRLMNNNLEKDIDASKSKHVVKPNKIIIKMGKVKGEYGYDSWQQLTAKKAKKRDALGRAAKDDNPAAGIMDLMKDMYDEGDDNMKKMIGETMYKQRMGKLNPNDPMGGMDDMMGGMGGMMGM
eukprot:CAMPEP_0172540492 /NCGR_PEP_ID=MMETSP1067-20121228/11491_1 /TAXON_ID=265564 ORGANISM="Thalassiosira punctigera, Strain Tpunct2005C2" /NCGR_SAMPLE_ID=MMETSP1067 /ASSEMBLY_ACC=CAM_ASM_000444 /LENGTH=317 /DNA_ID=CAMNT_0013326361 /DNA_START=77 /DNA_END=1030 /DNA_ORIENTATION=-